MSYKALIFVSIAAFAFVSIPTVTATNAAAADDASVKCDEAFYSSNDILFYNPCATSCSDAGSGTAADVTSLKGKNNGEKMFNFWVSTGLTSQQAAGITASMQLEAGFSPFRQETTQAWPGGGWGIAQFTGGQRDAATAFVKAAVGDDVFNQYYSPAYGGAGLESNGFVPTGVPTDVNDKFLLAELNYLATYIKGYIPNNVRVDKIAQDYKQVVPANTALYNYLKTVVQAGDVAIAWTYLYEYPANIKTAALDRSNSAANVMTLYSNGVSTTCGGNLSEGGMNLQDGIKFVNDYKNNPDNVKYIGGAGQSCAGGPLSNCVSLSIYFVNKYTDLKSNPTPGNGSTVVANLIAANPGVENGHSPRPYAIFSTPSGSQMCGSVKCGHTGIILGVDKARGVVVVGEAACGSPGSWDTAREYPLSRFDSDAYTYIYTDGHLKGDVK